MTHEQEPLEGNAGTFGSRTSQDLARTLLEDIFEPPQVDILRKEMDGVDRQLNMTSSNVL